MELSRGNKIIKFEGNLKTSGKLKKENDLSVIHLNTRSKLLRKGLLFCQNNLKVFEFLGPDGGLPSEIREYLQEKLK